MGSAAHHCGRVTMPGQSPCYRPIKPITLLTRKLIRKLIVLAGVASGVKTALGFPPSVEREGMPSRTELKAMLGFRVWRRAMR